MMSDFKARAPSVSFNTFLLVPILLLFVLLVVAVLRSPSLISASGIGSAIIVVAPLILATYALMSVAIAGRATVDLSVGPLIGFINVTLIQLHGADLVSSPIAVFLYAIAVGVAYQLLMGLIIIFVRVQPIIVALSGFLALSGINLVIMSRPGGTAPDWMMPWGAGTTIDSPILVILILATAGWLLFSNTAFYGHLRLMGSDERAAYTSGVRIYIVRLGAHVISGIFSALAALTFTALIGSGDPTQGTTYTLIAVTALVLGGTSLAGGRGGVTGSLLGAINLFLIGYVLATFSFGSVQGFVTDLAYGIILVISLLLTVGLPKIQRFIRAVSPYMLFMVLTLIFFSITLHKKYDYDRLATKTEVDQSQLSELLPPPVVLSGTEIVETIADNSENLNIVETVPENTTASISPDNGNIDTTVVVITDSATFNKGEASSELSMMQLEPDAPAASSQLTVADTTTEISVVTNTGLSISSFIFEPLDSDASTQRSESQLVRPITFAIIILLSFVLVLRAVVAQTGKHKMTPLIFVIISTAVLLGGYFLVEASSLPKLGSDMYKGGSEK